MPKVTIYLPDELAEAVREAELNVSQVAQGALRAALRRQAPLREDELPKVAARLRETEDEEAQRERDRQRRLGAQWATERASVTELEAFAEMSRQHWTSWRVPPEHSIREFMHETDGWDPNFRAEITRDEHFDAFIDGALDVWDQVRALL